MRRVKKRNNVLWIAAVAGCLAFGIAMLSGVVVLMTENSMGRVQLENTYERSFFDMADSVNNIEMNLSKMLVSAEDEQTIELAGEIGKQAQMAQTSLNTLPVSEETAYDATKFLNQIGDWCTSYTRALMTGAESEPYEEKIEELYAVTRNVNASIKDIGAKFDGSYRIIQNLKKEGISNLNDFSDSYDTLKNNTMEYPELIYDGPFSDKEGEKCFKALDSLEPVSLDAAISKARKLFSKSGLANIKSLGMSTEPEAYQLSGSINGGSMFLSVSKKGGKIICANTDLSAGGVKISKEKAKELALEYALECDYCEHLAPVWYNAFDGIAIVNLAPKINDVVYYTDLVKVKVALDSGRFLGVEASGFCTNNCSRELSPTISENTAKSKVSPKLTINDTRLALIPINQKELLTYEVACEYKGLDYFVYIDAMTGKQVNIMRVVDEDQGEMVM